MAYYMQVRWQSEPHLAKVLETTLGAKPETSVDAG